MCDVDQKNPEGQGNGRVSSQAPANGLFEFEIGTGKKVRMIKDGTEWQSRNTTIQPTSVALN